MAKQDNPITLRLDRDLRERAKLEAKRTGSSLGSLIKEGLVTVLVAREQRRGAHERSP